MLPTRTSEFYLGVLREVSDETKKYHLACIFWVKKMMHGERGAGDIKWACPLFLRLTIS